MPKNRFYKNNKGELSISTRILTKGLLASGLQVIFYIVGLYSLWYLAVLFFRPNNKEISSLSVGTSFLLFTIIVTVQNLLSSIIHKKWFTITLFSFTVIIYLIGWGEDINSYPFSSVIFITTGLIALTLKFYIDKKIDQRISSNIFKSNNKTDFESSNFG